jgi:hypothetical protein
MDELLKVTKGDPNLIELEKLPEKQLQKLEKRIHSYREDQERKGRAEDVDKDGEEKFRLAHPAGTETTVDENGTVIIADPQGNTLTLNADSSEVMLEDANGNTLTMNSGGTTVEDSNGNKIEMAASGITVKGTQVVVEGQQVMLAGSGGEPIIKGQSFLTLFMTHVHPSAMGPTGPPIPQGEMSSLSMKVMTS